jgi:c-di-GMP-binding flagellar brake protein YcgR
MLTPPQRRKTERVSTMRAYPYELAKSADSGTVELSEGHGHSINHSAGGMMLLLPEEVEQGQVFEIQVSSEVRKEASIKLLEVCWIRLIPITGCVDMYLVGTRFLFDLPVSS